LTTKNSRNLSSGNSPERISSGFWQVSHPNTLNEKRWLRDSEYVTVLRNQSTKGIASSANPAADTRYWHDLPSQIYLIPLVVEENVELQLCALDRWGRTTSSTQILVESKDAENPVFVLVDLE
ncbi:MAG: hypothetical protein ABIH23_12550, partial [bacterium]